MKNTPTVVEGTKAVPKLGPFPTKIGSEELWELIDMWDFSPSNKEKIKAILESDANIQGPHLFAITIPSRVEWLQSSKPCGNSSG